MINSDELKKIVEQQEIVALALITPKGLPHNTPVWIAVKDEKLYVMSRLNRFKTKYARLNPNCMIAFNWATVRGKIKVLERGSAEYALHKDNLDERYSHNEGYEEYKRNWDAILEITPTKLS